MTISSVLSFIIRLIFRRNSLLPPSLGLAAIFVLTFAPALFIYRYLVKIGTTRRHPTTGELLSPGEDLNQPGVTEWAFDVLYVTCMSFFSYAVSELIAHAHGAQGLVKSGAQHLENGSGGCICPSVGLPTVGQECADMGVPCQIPLYAFYKVWSSFISPMFFGRSSSSAAEDEDSNATESTSKRQQKLRKRSERGDPRVRTATSGKK